MNEAYQYCSNPKADKGFKYKNKSPKIRDVSYENILSIGKQEPLSLSADNRKILLPDAFPAKIKNGMASRLNTEIPENILWAPVSTAACVSKTGKMAQMEEIPISQSRRQSMALQQLPTTQYLLRRPLLFLSISVAKARVS